MHGIVWFYGAMVGYSFVFGKYTSLPEFILKEGVGKWLFYHGFAFLVLFLANLLLTYVDENYNTVTVALVPLEFFLAIITICCYVHVFWIPFFYYSVLWLVDWIVSSRKSVKGGIYGGAGMVDTLSLKPLALEGLVILMLLLLNPDLGNNWILAESLRLLKYGHP